MMFNIGDVVWQAHASQIQVWVICPECLGSGRLRVILGDDSEVSIPCICCERGYEGSPGKISTWEYQANAQQVTITGIESKLREGHLKTRYLVGCYSGEEENIFATREEALERAAVLMREYQDEEKKRLGYKEKQHKTWAWNVSYWRREIRHAKEKIARAESRLAVVPKNVKDAEQREAGATK